jgi:Cu+-exporting ATPase
MGDDQSTGGAQESASPAIDPVCGMEVDPAVSPFASTHGGQTIWFCCAGCKKAFDRKPGLYGPLVATGRGSDRA